MKDRWINAGFEEDELKPYVEPELDITDQKRIGKQNHSLMCVKLLMLLVKSHNCCFFFLKWRVYVDKWTPTTKSVLLHECAWWWRKCMKLKHECCCCTKALKWSCFFQYWRTLKGTMKHDDEKVNKQQSAMQRKEREWVWEWRGRERSFPIVAWVKAVNGELLHNSSCLSC